MSQEWTSDLATELLNQFNAKSKNKKRGSNRFAKYRYLETKL